MRAVKSTGKLSANAETTLQAVNTPSTASITAFRRNRENSSGRMGPDPATANANKLTSSPAAEISTPYRTETMGRIPTTPISVLIMLKTPSVKTSSSGPVFPPFLSIIAVRPPLSQFSNSSAGRVRIYSALT